jgi:NarL family two-component system response regulator LiaR
MAKIGVLIVDDHEIVRQGLRTYLELLDEIKVVGESQNGLEAIAQVHQHKPDVVLMDLVMPEMDGIQATHQIREISPETKVIVLTSFAEDDKVFPAIQAGAVGYLLKDVSPSDLAKAIEAVHRGDTQLHPDIQKKLMDQFTSPIGEPPVGPDELTPRELEVLQLIALGKSNRDLANELVISEKTVKTHVSNILNKLHLDDRTQAAIYAIKQGMDSDK